MKRQLIIYSIILFAGIIFIINCNKNENPFYSPVSSRILDPALIGNWVEVRTNTGSSINTNISIYSNNGNYTEYYISSSTPTWRYDGIWYVNANGLLTEITTLDESEGTYGYYIVSSNILYKYVFKRNSGSGGIVGEWERFWGEFEENEKDDEINIYIFNSDNTLQYHRDEKGYINGITSYHYTFSTNGTYSFDAVNNCYQAIFYNKTTYYTNFITNRIWLINNDENIIASDHEYLLDENLYFKQ